MSALGDSLHDSGDAARSFLPPKRQKTILSEMAQDDEVPKDTYNYTTIWHSSRREDLEFGGLIGKGYSDGTIIVKPVVAPPSNTQSQASNSNTSPAANATIGREGGGSDSATKESDKSGDLIRKVQERLFLPPENAAQHALCFGIRVDGCVEDAPGDKPPVFSPPNPSVQPSTKNPATVIKKSLVANFRFVAAGPYTLYLRVKAAERKLPQARFLARILVRYAVTEIVHTFYASFTVGDKDIMNWHYVKGDSQFEVRPHYGNARINVSIELDQNYHSDRLGSVLVRALELVPAEKMPLRADPEASFECSPQPELTILTQMPAVRRPVNDANAPAGDERAPATSPEKGVVARLATSKDGKYIAALTIFPDWVTVQVWPKLLFEKTARDDARTSRDLSQNGAFARIDCKKAHDVPLELILSDNGEYVAVYQAPRIGDWCLDSTLPKSDFGVKLFRNILVPGVQEVSVDIARNNFQDGIDRSSLRCLNIIKADPDHLKQAVGYATFVGKSENYWRSLPNRFVFCNGLYLDIYELEGDVLSFSHPFPLTDFTSNMWRTVACELAVRSIVNNMFIWVTDNGRHCSTWDLANGSNLGRIEIGGLQHDSDTKTPAMKVACNENIIAILGFDNSITTVDSSSGIVISRRIFDSQAPIENIAFPSAQSDKLAVFRHKQGDHDQQATLVDPLCLDVQVKVPSISPLSRSSVVSHLGLQPWNILDIVCMPDADKIRVHPSKLNESPKDGLQLPKQPQGTCPYELVITIPVPRLGGQETYARQVEIWKRDDSADPSPRSCIFSFIPEPWELYRPAGGTILPSGDRFVVYAGRTIQLWSLPTSKEPRCKLIFFWSATAEEQSMDTNGKTETDIVLDHHFRFNAAHIYEYAVKDDQTRFKASVVYQDKPVPVEKVVIPNSPLRLSDALMITEHCIQNIWLLALTHTLISPQSQDSDMAEQQYTNEDHARAIIDFVSDHINHSMESSKQPIKNDGTNRTTILDKCRTRKHKRNHAQEPGKHRVSILTTLLEPRCSPDFSTKFITSLLQSGRCTWVPRGDNTTNPIYVAISHGNVAALQILLDYCTDMARRRHPLYLAPIEECFPELISQYPEHLQATLRNTSYIPARGVEIYEPYGIICTYAWRPFWIKVWDFFSRQKRLSLKHYPEPTISYQIESKEASNHNERSVTFKNDQPEVFGKPYGWKVYVAPFPSLVTLDGSFSQFFQLAGKDGFENAALMAVLRFKNWQYGVYYWHSRLVMLLVFYSIFIAMVITHVTKSTTPGAFDDPSTLYLNHFWKVLISVGIFLGGILLLLEVYQLIWGLRYFRSPFNYIDLISIGVTTACFSETIVSHLISGTDDRPHQFFLTSFAILTTYLHLIAETRTIQRVGTIVNILMLIINKVRDFFLLFALVVIGFTHTLVYFFHAFRAQPKQDDACEQRARYPNGALSALTTTLFFLAGRYDSIGGDFEDAHVQFLFLIMGFYFLVVLFLLNVLIALMSDALSKSRKEGEQAWRKQLSEALAEGEITLRLLKTLGQYRPIKNLLDILRERPSFHKRTKRTPTYLFYLVRAQNTDSLKKSDPPEK